jgi:signal transduction histidine kinase
MGFAKYCGLIIVISIIFSLILSVLGIIYKERSAYFLCAGFSVLSMGGIVHILYIFALIPENFLTINSLAISSSSEMLIFTLLLTDRFNFIHLDKLQGDKDLEVTNQNLLAEIKERQESEKRQVELIQQLNHMQKLESIGRLTSGVAHDFNNLLMAISGHNEFIKYSAEDVLLESSCRKQLNAELLESSSQIQIASKKAANLIEKMLLYCRRDGEWTVHNPVLDLNSLLKENIKMLRSTIPSTINFELDLVEKNFDLSAVDETHINQIIVNLFINARDAMNGKGTITLKTKVVDAIESLCSCCQFKNVSMATARTTLEKPTM